MSFIAYAKFPCKGCKKKESGCHSRCSDYLNAKIQNEIIKEKVNILKRVDKDLENPHRHYRNQ